MWIGTLGVNVTVSQWEGFGARLASSTLGQSWRVPEEDGVGKGRRVISILEVILLKLPFPRGELAFVDQLWLWQDSASRWGWQPLLGLLQTITAMFPCLVFYLFLDSDFPQPLCPRRELGLAPETSVQTENMPSMDSVGQRVLSLQTFSCPACKEVWTASAAKRLYWAGNQRSQPSLELGEELNRDLMQKGGESFSFQMVFEICLYNIYYLRLA